jgi:RimJ/RimL family protein N-acetyltransferase
MSKQNIKIQEIVLRPVLEEDLDIFFKQMSDPLANQMAAFTSEDPTNRGVFDQKWQKIREDDTIILKTILSDGVVSGHIAKFEMIGKPEITYWVGKEYWGRGIATNALTLFLDDFTERPLYARAAKDNIGSIRVLEKCGFNIIGVESAFANALGMETEEIIFELCQ